MAANPIAANDSSRQSDLLLWVAGGVVATVGVAWLLISQPWSAGPERSVATAAAPRTSAGGGDGALLAMATSAVPSADRPAAESLNDPLKMARLAYDAGMLVEPREYSAWTLYAHVLEAEPANMEAREGLTTIADELLRRGDTALEQGRFDDVRDTVTRILSVLPAHEGATALAARMPAAGSAATAAPAAVAEQIPQPAPAPAVAAAPAPTPAAAAEARRVAEVADSVAQAHEAFTAAMSASRLLTPEGESAKHFVAVLTAVAPEHELTLQARERLSSELLSRAAQSLEALDIAAATTWIEEAQLIGVNPGAVSAVRAALTTQIIAMESQKLLPASSLKVVKYVPPEYPSRALSRGMEGWVDVQFTVAVDGTTRDIKVTDASHESYFRTEAAAAVAQWRFEPRVLMGRAIEQRTYSKLRFVQ